MELNSDVTAAQVYIDAAMQALKKGDRRSARHNAQRAAALAPQLEQPWLLLAYLASPGAVKYFLERALQVNPTSPKALAGMEWLKKQSVQSAAPAGQNLPGSLPLAEQQQPNTIARYRLGLLVLLVVLVAMLSGVALLTGATRMADSRDNGRVKAIQVTLKAGTTLESSPTPSLTWTAAPTETSTPAPTTTNTASPIPSATASVLPSATASALPTGTSEPTATASMVPSPAPSATALPSPTQPKATPLQSTTYTVAFGDTLNLIAQRFNIPLETLIAANQLSNPSMIFVGQVLTIPAAGLPPVASKPTTVPIPAAKTGKGKEILVDISEQHMYAYENDKLVFSLVVSTGTGNSTRIGVFKVLDKIPRAYSSRFNIWMPWWMGIYWSGTLENGIHGLPLLMNGVELWGNLLGKPATYGCVESKTSEAKLLFDWAEIGTPVYIQR